ncbi:hypothetical protein [Chryseobacterium sp. ON_d1]|uniref:hypothetical protein n=1 Tax=Chryseobacterium sp. ON_d1 TaxID=2583211 RepID=UPI001159C545|nr:hypothetical protein [Chryseobacterium sp. ON_d1]GEJ46037.1 hypothetical protein CRS_26450 [Chryseobacterium sp. ON_d1]
MDYEKSKEIYQKAISTWGEIAQLEMLQEESTELALATRKYIRIPNDENMTKLASEVADVKIMLEQLEFMYPDITVMSNDWRKNKLSRLEQRLNKLNFED